MSETAQARQPTIGTSSPVTIGLVITLLGVAFAAGSAHVRLGATAERLEAMEARSERSSDASQAVVLRIQRVEDAVENIGKTMASMDRKLDRALNRQRDER